MDFWLVVWGLSYRVILGGGAPLPGGVFEGWGSGVWGILFVKNNIKIFEGMSDFDQKSRF
jgi:hypothetical protein